MSVYGEWHSHLQMSTVRLKDGSYKLPGGLILSEEVYGLNQKILEHDQDQTELSRWVAKEKRKKLRNLFDSLWEEFGVGLTLHCEYKFFPGRKWAFDYAHLPTKTAIELEGGTNSRKVKSRHTTPEGYRNDREKYNTATELGWAVISLTSDMITSDHIKRTIDLIQRRYG